MAPLFIVSVWVIYFFGNIAIAEWNDTVRRKRIANKNPKQIEHFWYGLGYGILCYVPFHISGNYWELFSLLLLHISVFSVAYNRFSDLPAFHLSLTSNAVSDRIMRGIGLKSTEEVNIIAFCLSTVFVMLQIFKV